MGQRGPAATPTTVLEGRGSWRAKMRGDEPKPLAELPEPPAWLAEVPLALDLWGEIGPMLVAAGLMAKPYTPTLAATVDAIATYIARRIEAAKTPLVYHTETGFREHPVHKSADRARTEMKRWLACWGLSPADVASVSKSGKAGESLLDRFKLDGNDN